MWKTKFVTMIKQKEQNTYMHSCNIFKCSLCTQDQFDYWDIFTQMTEAKHPYRLHIIINNNA